MMPADGRTLRVSDGLVCVCRVGCRRVPVVVVVVVVKGGFPVIFVWYDCVVVKVGDVAVMEGGMQ